jgi:hypothetical protein
MRTLTITVAILILALTASACGGSDSRSQSATPAATSEPKPELTAGEVCELVRQKIVDSLPSAESSAPSASSMRLATRAAQRGLPYRDLSRNSELERRQRFISQLASPDCKPTFRAGTWTLTMSNATFTIRESTRVVTATNDAARGYLK